MNEEVSRLKKMQEDCYDLVAAAVSHDKKYLLNVLKIVYDMISKAMEVEVNHERSDRTED